MQRRLTFFLGIIILLKLTACDNPSLERSDTTSSDHPLIIGVSVWDKISTRSEPRRKSATTTLLSLGESFIYLDTFAIDSSYNNTKFLKARLSDSSVVWVYGFASVLNAIPAVITDEVPLYMRPDLLTITDERMNTMEIVAVVEEWDNWIKVVNEKKEKVGWIKKEHITENTIDLAFAVLAKRKLDEQDPEQKIKNIEDMLETNPYPTSIFTTELKEVLKNENENLKESRNNQDWDDQNRNREEQDRRKRN
ncbi:MAG: hypothetical protein PF450_01845 [Bacteroidales bacterium]|jgi:hypothetical protein|nr:hypothetical protein [Bacteroidales bacterium]